MHTRCTPLHDADHELELLDDSEFEADTSDDDHLENPPFHRAKSAGSTTSCQRVHPERPKSTSGTITVPGAHNIEQNYDNNRTPLGPGTTLHNHITNSNGESPSPPFGTWARALFAARGGAILPTHYANIPTNKPEGTQNENAAVEPTSAVQPEIRSEGSSTNVIPEETQNTVPPSYAAVQSDAVPLYSPVTAKVGVSSLEISITDARMIVGHLPSGTVLSFCLCLWVSFFGEIIGFIVVVMIYLFISNTHAAKFGSRAGLGLLLIRYSTFSLAVTDNKLPVADGNVTTNLGDAEVDKDESSDFFNGVLDASLWKWLSFSLATLGWFLLISSFIGFWLVKECEPAVLAANAGKPLSHEGIACDTAMPQQGLPEGHECMPLASNSSLANPSPQERTEAAALPAGV